ncbi:2-dehydropantoate 2-reductase [Lipingzhangella halophila]|uniref:2-dehydropantoate 2-reductase n=1 Tax=Lipingzhangella halophila TaxID=1783352 RepID=A0A7W7VZV4_9ACTN|nr:2-dehydropantoate 2-reductase [Lipingzhangella halophila]MBB4929217.1 2-dehydropantoate 2-reductase [Lipingzhangella halophila]
MRVAVLGAGAIGAYVGACLQRAGVEVHLIARGPHLEAIRRSGVQVHSPRGDFVAHPHATDRPEEVGPVDHIFLGLKANQYASAGPMVQPMLHESTTIIAAQNGIPWWYFHGVPSEFQGHRLETVDPGGSVSAALPTWRAIGCVVYAATEISAPGQIQHLEGTRLSIGEPDGSQSDRCMEFADAMVAGGLKCPVEPDLRHDIWVKLMGNIAFNPISALTRATMLGICQNTATRELVVDMMRETLAVAESLDVHPQISIERRLNGAERAGDHKTSTLQDLEKGKPLELDAILGAVVELADLTRTEIPVLRAVNALADLLNAGIDPSA